MTTRTLSQKHCGRTNVVHPAHNWTWRPYGGASTHVDYRCSGRKAGTCKHCSSPARDDGSDYADVCTQWPHCRTEPTQPFDPFAGIDENTEADASHPAVS